MNTSKSLGAILDDYAFFHEGNKLFRDKEATAAAIVEAVEGIYGDSDGLREFAGLSVIKSLPPTPSKRQQILEEHWMEFIAWIPTYSIRGSSGGGIYGRIVTENGMDVTENWNIIPTETNFWIWYADNKLTKCTDLVATDKEARNG